MTVKDGQIIPVLARELINDQSHDAQACLRKRHCKTQIVDYRPQTEGKMQTEGKVQTADRR